MQPIEIIYTHDDFIIINKPCNVSVHKDHDEIGLLQIIAAQLGLTKVWLVHRLDKITSGLLILALNPQSAAEISQLFAQRKVEKTYIALSVHKPKKKQGVICGDMQKSRRGTWKLSQTKENPALTRFYSTSCEANLRLFVLFPQTGKTHQIRVAMKSLGSAILGDRLYGDQTPCDRTYLHAYALQFNYRGESIAVTCPPKCGQFFQRNSVLEKLSVL